MADALNDRIARWKRDPVAFVREVLRDPETGRPFQIYEVQERFLREAFTLTPDGRLPFPELVYSCPKKSGKTATAAWIAIYVAVVIGGPFAEVYCLSNDYEQSVGRVFEAARRVIEVSPLLAGSAKITASRIEFPSTGSFIQACASDYSGFAGANPALCIFDELWAYTSERGTRLFDEAVPPPRKVSARLTVTYAGFQQESVLLEGLYKRGLQGEEIAAALYRQPGLLMFWSHTPVAPWQDERWLEQMRSQLRPNAYLRLIENRWTSGESGFVDMADFDRCVDPDARPLLSDRNVRIFIGLDGSYAHDSTAIAAVAFDAKTQRVRLITHKIFTPTAGVPVDFNAVEAELIRLRHCFVVQAIFFDPYQLVALSQRMVALGLPMESFAQTSSNLEAAATNLAELIRHGNLALYADPEIRLAMSRTVAVETARGVRISKKSASHRIDIIAALSFACFAAVRQGQHHFDIDREFQRRATETIAAQAYRRQSRGAFDAPAAGFDYAYGDGDVMAAHEDKPSSLLPRNMRRWGGY